MANTDDALLSSIKHKLSKEQFQQFSNLKTDKERYRFCADLAQSEKARTEFLEQARAAEEVEKTAFKIQDVTAMAEEGILYNEDRSLLEALQQGPTLWQRTMWKLQQRIYFAADNVSHTAAVVAFSAFLLLVAIGQGYIAWRSGVVLHAIIMIVFTLAITVGGGCLEEWLSRLYKSTKTMKIAGALVGGVLMTVLTIGVLNFVLGYRYILMPYAADVGYRVSEGQVTDVYRNWKLFQRIDSPLWRQDGMYWMRLPDKTYNTESQVYSWEKSPVCEASQKIYLQPDLLLVTDIIEPQTEQQVRELQVLGNPVERVSDKIYADFREQLSDRSNEDDKKSIDFRKDASDLKAKYANFNPSVQINGISIISRCTATRQVISSTESTQLDEKVISPK